MKNLLSEKRSKPSFPEGFDSMNDLRHPKEPGYWASGHVPVEQEPEAADSQLDLV
jgi:hypothetical protein